MKRPRKEKEREDKNARRGRRGAQREDIKQHKFNLLSVNGHKTNDLH